VQLYSFAVTRLVLELVVAMAVAMAMAVVVVVVVEEWLSHSSLRLEDCFFV
jgi:hypothetical protein